MKYVKDFPLFWELKLVNLLFYKLYYSERPKKLGIKILIVLDLDIFTI